MATSSHEAIREYLMRESKSKGKGDSGQKMRLDPVTGTFKLVSANEAGYDEIAEITAEDMRSFAAVRCCAA